MVHPASWLLLATGSPSELIARWAGFGCGAFLPLDLEGLGVLDGLLGRRGSGGERRRTEVGPWT